MEDMWAEDVHPAFALIETRLSDVLSSALYHLHRAAHKALELPSVSALDLQAAYRTVRLAKADEGWSVAARTFADLRYKPREAREPAELAHALTAHYFERGVIEDEMRAAVFKANALSLIQATGQSPQAAEQYRSWASGIVDPDQSRAVAWAAERACEHVTRLGDTTRAVLADAVLGALISRQSPQELSAKIVSLFGTLNRDARRLAITEISSARSNGYLMGLPDGAQLTWFAAPDACPHCLHLHGTRLTVRAQPTGQVLDVWPGKSNVGRSLSSTKRSGEARRDDELGWPCIPLHPNCRCRYVRVAQPIPGVSPRLEAALMAIARLP